MWTGHIPPYLSIYLSIDQLIYLSIDLLIALPVYLSIYLSISYIHLCASVYLYRYRVREERERYFKELAHEIVGGLTSPKFLVFAEDPGKS